MYMSMWRRQLINMTSRFGVRLAFLLLVTLLTSLFYFLCSLRCGSFHLVLFLMFSILLFYWSFIFCASLLILLMSLIVTSVYSIYLISRWSWRHCLYILVLVLISIFSFNIGIFFCFLRAIFLYVYFFLCINLSRWLFKFCIHHILCY